MPDAKWNGQVIAETEQFESVKGNLYFPRSAMKEQFSGPARTARYARGKVSLHISIYVWMAR